MSDQPLQSSELDGFLSGLCDAGHWYVGLSGGVDSTVLLHLLQEWRKTRPGAPEITAIHVHHGLQAAADDWKGHCQWICRMLQLPIIVRKVTVEVDGQGVEAAARSARYSQFEEQLAEGDVLFLGHHLDDQVETFFLRLMRGAGLEGLAAMPARRSLGAGTLVRPLLDISRSRLEAYAGRHGLDYVEDPSNNDTRLDRNYLRNEVLPRLEARWPGYRRTVTRASEHMSGAVRALREELPLPEVLLSSMGDPGIALGELVKPALEAAAMQLRMWLEDRGLPSPDQAALGEFLRQLRESGERARPRLQCSAYTLQRYRDGVYLLPDQSLPICNEPLELLPGEVRDIPGVGRVGLEKTRSGGGLALRSGEALGMDWRSGGERCRPVGRSGSASLKKLLQEADVPPWWRDRVPLLWLDGELLAVGDLWLCESSRYRAQGGRGKTRWRVTWKRNIQPLSD